MTIAERAKERPLGWLFAGVAAFHLLLLRPQEMVMVAALVLLLLGAVLRSRGRFVPRWLGILILPLGALGVIFSPGMRWGDLMGDLAAIATALLLLRPVTIGRAQWLIVTLLVQLAAMVFKPFPSVGTVLIIVDVGICLILMEQACRPPEAVINIWVSLLRSLRTIVPVSVIVTSAFWLFPSLSNPGSSAYTGFSGQGLLDPGSIMELAQSHRLAFTAKFADNQPPPPPESLYWRGQVLEINRGMRWERPATRASDRPPILLAAPPVQTDSAIRYTQSMAETRGGLVPVLDHALFVEAWREGDPIAVLDFGGGTLSAVGEGTLQVDAVSSLDRPRDPPPTALDHGAIDLPKNLQNDAAVQQIARDIFAGRSTVEEKLRGIGEYLESHGFAYSSRPGRIVDLREFLTEGRRGFCEHYAAASANLLRLGGVPSRIVTGYRGGRWNPWTHTITVRDAQAHAWVEAWDESAGEWRRFDPTSFVAPEIDRRIFREMNFPNWAWYRQAWTFGEAVITNATDWVSETWRRLVSPEAWEQWNQILLGGLLAIAVVWLVWTNWKWTSVRPRDAAIRCLTTLERRAGRGRRARLPGETPLGWLKRLGGQPVDADEEAHLQRFADRYEQLVYAPGETTREGVAELRRERNAILQLWRQARPA